MGGPASVCNTAMRIKDLCGIDTGLCNKLSKFHHLAHLFKRKHLILLVAVDDKSGRVVASVLETGETWYASVSEAFGGVAGLLPYRLAKYRG